MVITAIYCFHIERPSGWHNSRPKSVADKLALTTTNDLYWIFFLVLFFSIFAARFDCCFKNTGFNFFGTFPITDQICPKIKELLTGNIWNYRAFVNSTNPLSKYTNSIEESWNENMKSRLMIIWVCVSLLPHHYI